MLISTLHDRLRAHVSERIGSRALTGTELAEKAGFRQAHISNFLNHRRGLSLEAMDRVMEVPVSYTHLDVYKRQVRTLGAGG